MTPDPADTLRHQLAAELHQAAELTADPRFRVAAGILLGKRGGRRRRDDAAAVIEIRALLEAKVARSARGAAMLIAKSRRGPLSAESDAIQMAAAYRRWVAEK